jgi:hypothetical protein
MGWHEEGPGLYHDEIAIELDDGTQVAVSVERHWQENGSGIAFHGYARWIDKDGSTKKAPNGASVEASISFHADAITLTKFSEDDIATEIARVMIGEDPQLHRDVPQEDGTTTQHPVVDLAEQVRLNASIRHQVKAVNATKSSVINL